MSCCCYHVITQLLMSGLAQYICIYGQLSVCASLSVCVCVSVCVSVRVCFSCNEMRFSLSPHENML